MKFTATNRALWAALIVCTAVTALTARALFAERQITTGVILKLCKKNTNGGWDIIEQARGNLNFTANVAEAASGQISTDHVWNFRGDKGTEGTARIKGPGRFSFDSGSGLLTFNLPFEIALKNGKRITREVQLTTASLATPIGQLSGKKAVIQGDSIIAILIGFTQFPARDLIDESQKEPGKIAVPGVVGGGAGLGDLAVTVEFDARAKR
ncbi:MAG: hypothetical protein HYR56_05900 [Acidobacteria bacterium]|nr:hypothetical protein [Acidobacteriota bacterium]MBI3424707.1 hypothetical protein [Acidobacteriota bacterium]